jgi:hypothetical protein
MYRHYSQPARRAAAEAPVRPGDGVRTSAPAPQGLRSTNRESRGRRLCPRGRGLDGRAAHRRRARRPHTRQSSPSTREAHALEVREVRSRGPALVRAGLERDGHPPSETVSRGRRAVRRSHSGARLHRRMHSRRESRGVRHETRRCAHTATLGDTGGQDHWTLVAEGVDDVATTFSPFAPSTRCISSRATCRLTSSAIARHDAHSRVR